MQTRNLTTINQTLKGDDMVNLHSLGAVGVDVQQGILADPLGSAALNVFSAEVKTGGVVGVVQPAFASGGVNSLFSGFVSGSLLLRDFLSICRVRLVSLAAPCVLLFKVASKVSRRSLGGIGVGTGFALMTYGSALFVILGTGLFNTAAWAHLGNEGLFTGFHNTDIIARWGDVKLGEFGGR